MQEKIVGFVAQWSSKYTDHAAHYPKPQHATGGLWKSSRFFNLLKYERDDWCDRVPSSVPDLRAFVVAAVSHKCGMVDINNQ